MATEVTFQDLDDILSRDDALRMCELLVAGLDANAADEDDASLLHYAANHGAEACMRALLAAGAVADAEDIQGCTPLEKCIGAYYREGSLDCARLLVAAGARVEPVDEEVAAPLVCAATSRGCEAHLRLLVAAGADVNRRDFLGRTALHHAVEANNAEAVRILLAAGADPAVRDSDAGETPRDCARGQRCAECRALLTDALLARGISMESEVDMEVSEVRRRLRRPAVIFLSREDEACPEKKLSRLGRVTRQRPGEDWPRDSEGKPLVPLATLFIDELPAVPTALDGMKLITVFTPQDPWEAFDEPRCGCVIRTYDSTEGLELCDYGAAEFTPRVLLPQVVENDMPQFPDCGGTGELWGAIDKLGRVLGLDYEEDIMEGEYDTHKLGGYPGFAQDAPELPEGYAFVLQIASDPAAELDIGDDGKYFFFYNPRTKDWRVHMDCG